MKMDNKNIERGPSMREMARDPNEVSLPYIQSNQSSQNHGNSSMINPKDIRWSPTKQKEKAAKK